MSVNRFFTPEAGKKAAVALFLSGTGSNAGVLLEYIKNSDAAFAVTVLVTDAPENSFNYNKKIVLSTIFYSFFNF